MQEDSYKSGSCALKICATEGVHPTCLEHLWNKTLGFRGVFQCLPEVKAIESSAFLERAMGIEPMSVRRQVIGLALSEAPVGVH